MVTTGTTLHPSFGHAVVLVFDGRDSGPRPPTPPTPLRHHLPIPLVPPAHPAGAAGSIGQRQPSAAIVAQYALQPHPAPASPALQVPITHPRNTAHPLNALSL